MSGQAPVSVCNFPGMKSFENIENQKSFSRESRELSRIKKKVVLSYKSKNFEPNTAELICSSYGKHLRAQ